MIKNINEVEKKKCIGCFGCMSVCPAGAINKTVESDGFFYPSVDSEKCINCGKCLNFCPAYSNDNGYKIRDYYIFQSKNNDNLKRSSSGGVFCELADYVLNLGGYVCGCVFDDDCMLNIVITNNRDTLKKMQGSKYVQSYITMDTFNEVDRLIKDDEIVLFVGTPCQVAALRKKYGIRNNLYLVDLICHGVGSPVLFKMYLEKLKKKKNLEISDISFRSKSNRDYPDNFHLRIESKNKDYDKNELNDNYFSAFAGSRILRESCYSCDYSTKERMGDISIGDYLTTLEIPVETDRKKGLSLVCINTDLGAILFESIEKNSMVFKLINEPYKKNLNRPEHRPQKRDMLIISDTKKANIVLRRNAKEIIKSFISADKRRKIKKALKKG